MPDYLQNADMKTNALPQRQCRRREALGMKSRKVRRRAEADTDTIEEQKQKETDRRRTVIVTGIRIRRSRRSLRQVSDLRFC